MGNIQDKRAFSIVEFGEIFGISRSLVYKLISSGAIKTVKIGNRTVLLKSEIDRFAAALEAEAA